MKYADIRLARFQSRPKRFIARIEMFSRSYQACP